MGTVSTLGARQHEVTGVSSEEELEAERAAEEKATREALHKYWTVRQHDGVVQERWLTMNTVLIMSWL